MGQNDSSEWQGYKHQLLNDKKQRGILLPHPTDITRSILETFITIPYLVDIILEYSNDILHTSQTLRHPRSKHSFCGFLKDQSNNDLNTVCKLFHHSYQQHAANKYIGYRPWIHPLQLVSHYIHEIIPEISKQIIDLCYMYYYEKSEWSQTLSSINRKLKRLQYQWLTYKQVGDYANLFGHALSYLQIPANSSIAIYSVSRPETCICNIGILSQGYTCVPISCTGRFFAGRTLLEILNGQQVPLIVVEKNKLQQLFETLDENDCKSLKYIVQIDVQKHFSNLHEYVSEKDVKIASLYNIKLMGLSEMFQLSLNSSEKDLEPNIVCVLNLINFSSITEDDIAYKIYQDKKFIHLSHGSIASTVASLTRSCVQLTAEDTYYSYLPLGFLFGICYDFFVTTHGAKIAYYQGLIKMISGDCRAIRPTLFIGPPRIFDKVYGKYKLLTSQFGFAKKWFVSTAEESSRKQLRKGERSNFYDECIWKVISKEMGFNQLRCIICVQLPLKPHIAEFMRVLLPDVMLQQMYGITELCPLITITDIDDFCVGHVGVPIDNIEIRLIDVPEYGFFTESKDLSMCCGEIQVRGYHMGKVDKGCWICTGDIGKMNPNGTLSIIDKKRSGCMKTSIGEYIVFSKVEQAYEHSVMSVAQIYIYGNSFKSFIVGVVVPHALELIPKLKECGLWVDKNEKLEIEICSPEYLEKFKEICEQNRSMIKEFIVEDMNKCQLQSNLKKFEYVKDIYCEFELNELLQGFSVDNGTLEPTFQKKRAQLFIKYLDKLKAMYIAHGEPPNHNNKHWL